MSSAVPRFALSVVLSLLLACAGRSSPDTETDPEAETETEREADASSDALLRVENRGFSDMVIFILRGTQKIRLGIANGNTTATFTIANQYTTTGPLRFIADPIGSDRAPVSDELVVQPGDVVTLTIPPN